MKEMSKEKNTCPANPRVGPESVRLADVTVGEREKKHMHGERGFGRQALA